MTRAEKIRPPFPDSDLTPPGIEADLHPRPLYQAPEYLAAGKLNGKRALITGGDSGIGRAVAVLFAREGAEVAICHLAEEAEDARETVRRIEAHGRRAVSIAGDVTERSFCETAVELCVHELGGLDILVNNAAFQKHVERVQDLDPDQWDRTFKTNIYGYFFMTQAAMKHLPDGSAIVNTGSITGLEGSGGLLDYASTKGAIHAFTKSLAQQLAERRIRVNCVAPGPVWTPLNPAEREPEDVARFGGDTRYGRPAQPEEIAPAYVFFASAADSGYVTGEILTLLGGETRAA
jgi:NAD(P)-dependent dehydrogenase (short-subunit alcohol dehydrogenase family)